MDDVTGSPGGPWGSGRNMLDELVMAPRAVLEGVPDAVVAADQSGRIVFVNALAEEMFGYSGEELLEAPIQTLWPERVRERYTRNMNRHFAAPEPFRFTTEAWGLHKDGSEFPGEMSWGTVETSAGRLLIAVGRDISARRATETRLRAIALMGERALAGADPAELAEEATELLHSTLPLSRVEVRLADGALLITAGAEEGELITLPIGAGDELRLAPRRTLTDEEVNAVHAVANILATALARLQDEQRMRHDAVHDPLTGLANRALLRDRLEHALARSEREGGQTAVLFIDLDNFKQVNDLHGHAAGDAVLAELGQRLRSGVRPADTVGRMGGDEFVVVCEEVDEPQALVLARRLEEALRPPHRVAERDYTLTASIGVAIGGGDADRLLAAADAAVYRAKEAGGGQVVLGEEAAPEAP